MEFEKVTKVNVADTVFEQMKQMILTGDWKSGDRIAGENELARQFGVSRVSVRTAIQRLTGMGMLTARHGDGTFVTDLVGGMMQSRLMQQLLLSTPQLEEVLQFRMMVEVGGASLAARNASPGDIAQLRALEKQMKSECSISEFAGYDLSYHNAIAVISGNSLLTRVMSVIHDIYANAMLETIRLRGIEEGRNNHTLITEAIADHDQARAAEQMRVHIQSVIDQINGRKEDL